MMRGTESMARDILHNRSIIIDRLLSLPNICESREELELLSIDEFYELEDECRCALEDDHQMMRYEGII